MGVCTRYTFAATAVEPVSLAEMLDWLHLTDYDSASTIERLIKAAREQAEEITGLAFISRSVDAYYDRFEEELVLPCPPAATITGITGGSVKYYDTAGTLQTVTSGVYELGHANGGVGRVRPQYNQVWPSDVRGQPESILVHFSAGYGASAASVPERARQFVLYLASHWYINRTIVAAGAANPVPHTFEDLLGPLKREAA